MSISNIVAGTTNGEDSAAAINEVINYVNSASAVGTSVLTAANASAARSAIGAGTSSLAIGTTATTAAAGNHTHSAATASANGFMSSAMFNLISGMPPFRLVAVAPETTDSTGQKWDLY